MMMAPQIVHFTLLFTFFLARRIKYAIAIPDRNCKLPEQPYIDWTKMTGKWYEHMANDGGKPHCDIIDDITYQLYGFDICMMSSNPRGDVIYSLTISIKNNEGPYKVWYFAKNTKEGRSFLEELRMKYGRNVWKSYYGERYVWTFGRQRTRGMNDILREKNKLVEVGDGWNDAILYISTC
uniref:uncharacterized protein LOC120332750 isoform X2 n=1 Tax=Styela clava TaxID=7725 RepID=UPI00193A5112|nr:uncharacterized protein LOC120332750 isoform X2 [Styela clava]